MFCLFYFRLSGLLDGSCISHDFSGYLIHVAFNHAVMVAITTDRGLHDRCFKKFLKKLFN